MSHAFQQQFGIARLLILTTFCALVFAVLRFLQLPAAFSIALGIYAGLLGGYLLLRGFALVRHSMRLRHQVRQSRGALSQWAEQVRDDSRKRDSQ